MIDLYFGPRNLALFAGLGRTSRAMLEALAGSLAHSGFARGSIRSRLRAAAHVCAWLEVRRVTFNRLDDDLLGRFVSHLAACRCSWRLRGDHSPAASGAKRFLAYLRDQGIARRVPEPDIPEILSMFECWMVRHRGVTASTLITYRPILVEMIEKVGGPEGVTAAAVREFVSDRASRHGRSRAKTVVAALRMLLRYLALRGLIDGALVDSVPSIASWRLSSLPTYLSPEDVERILAAPDASTSAGRRDRALLLLLARLGLRASDVAALRLDDIDWRAGTLDVTGKGRHASRLPLPQDVGNAIIEYLANGRPTAKEDHVFLTILAPIRPLRSSAISSVVTTAAMRADVHLPRAGAHVLRHSIATALLRAGVELPAIGVLLRHRKQETTTQYAKVDVLALCKIAQPWPLGT